MLVQKFVANIQPNFAPVNSDSQTLSFFNFANFFQVRQCFHQALIFADKLIVFTENQIVFSVWQLALHKTNFTNKLSDFREIFGFFRVKNHFRRPARANQKIIFFILKRRPNRLGDERRERMREFQNLRQREGQKISVKISFARFHKPICKIVPEQMIDFIHRLCKIVIRDVLIYAVSRRLNFAQNPVLGRRLRLCKFRKIGLEIASKFSFNETRDVPKFIREISPRQNCCWRKRLRLTSSAVHHNPHTQRISTIFVYNVKWIYDISLALAHLFSVLIQNQPVHKNIAKRNFVGRVQTKHDHSRHPRPRQINAGFHHAVWIKFRELAAVQIIRRDKRPLTA